MNLAQIQIMLALIFYSFALNLALTLPDFVFQNLDLT